MNETIVTVVGNVASDVTMKRVGVDQRPVVSFRVVSSERRWDKATEAWVDGDRFSASVSCWRRLADGVVKSLVKGDPVVVMGRLSVREYEVNGERRFATDITATAVGPDLARSAAEVTRRSLAAVDGASRESAPDGDGRGLDPETVELSGAALAEEVAASADAEVSEELSATA